jgi:hypothetical protein
MEISKKQLQFVKYLVDLFVSDFANEIKQKATSESISDIQPFLHFFNVIRQALRGCHSILFKYDPNPHLIHEFMSRKLKLILHDEPILLDYFLNLRLLFLDIINEVFNSLNKSKTRTLNGFAKEEEKVSEEDEEEMEDIKLTKEEEKELEEELKQLEVTESEEMAKEKAAEREEAKKERISPKEKESNGSSNSEEENTLLIKSNVVRSKLLKAFMTALMNNNTKKLNNYIKEKSHSTTMRTDCKHPFIKEYVDSHFYHINKIQTFYDEIMLFSKINEHFAPQIKSAFRNAIFLLKLSFAKVIFVEFRFCV